MNKKKKYSYILRQIQFKIILFEIICSFGTPHWGVLKTFTGITLGLFINDNIIKSLDRQVMITINNSHYLLVNSFCKLI